MTQVKARVEVLKARIKIGIIMRKEIGTSSSETITVFGLKGHWLTHVLEFVGKFNCPLPELGSVYTKKYLP
jgi:hypothetical protein